MKRQSATTKLILVGLALTVSLLQVAPSQGAPHQHLVYYHQPVPQHRQTANVVVLPANGAGIQQFAAAGVPLPVGGQYVLVSRQPGASPVLYMTRDDGEKPTEPGNEGTGIIDSITNFFVGFIPTIPGITGGTDEKPVDSGTSAASDPEKPVKIEEAAAAGNAEKQPEQPTQPEQPAKLETLDEDPPKPVIPAVPAVVPAPGQRFVVIGQPQFFGNYDALRNHAVQQGLGTKGAVSSFLLLKNQQIVPLASAANGKLQEEAVNSVAQVPVLEVQKYVSSVKQNPQPEVTNVASAPVGYQNLVYVQPEANSADDSASITVEAVKVRPHKTKEGEEQTDEDTEDVEADPPGPSIAQVKPQAIALAGPGGVAAAAPIGTALVGAGGLAVAAPSATAVAGPSGGAPPPIGSHASAALASPAAFKAYLLEQQSRGSYPGSYHVAYNV